MELSSTYTFEMVKKDGKNARRALRLYQWTRALVPIRALMNRLVTPNSAVSLLLAFNFGIISAVHFV